MRFCPVSLREFAQTSLVKTVNSINQQQKIICDTCLAHFGTINQPWMCVAHVLSAAGDESSCIPGHRNLVVPQLRLGQGPFGFMALLVYK